MKKSIITALLIACLTFAFISCGKNEMPSESTDKIIDGIVYSLSDDGTHYVVSGTENENITTAQIKNECKGLPVTEIKAEAFKDNVNITKVIIPKGVEKIGDDAFDGCFKLVEVYNLSSLDIKKEANKNGNIGAYPINIYTSMEESKQFVTDEGFLFYLSNSYAYLLGYTGSEKNITLPNDCRGNEYEIYRYAFYKRNDLTSITLPKEENTIYSIGERAFFNCTEIEDILLPEGVVSIGDSAFSGCVKLKSISLPSGVRSVSDYLFEGCKSIKSVTLPDSATFIGEYAFQGCESLKKITVPKGVKTIGKCAFRWCSQMEKIYLPNTVTSVGIAAFEECVSLNIYCEKDTAWKKWGKDWNPDNIPVSLTGIEPICLGTINP